MGDRVIGEGRRRTLDSRLITCVRLRSRLAVYRRLAVSPRLTRRESIAARIANGVDAGVGRRLIDSITPGEGAWATALPDLPFRGALRFLGIGDAVAVAGQILGQKETVDRGLPPGAADAVGRIERIESRLDFRDVDAAIAVAVDATAGAGRVDRAAGGDPDRQAGWVSRVEVAPVVVPGVVQRWIEIWLLRGACRCVLCGALRAMTNIAG